ncbi:chromosome partitioning protein ParB [Bifidobacterium rousetti]|uniref:ParB/RepB/Spo0J family partition protein n=1 Tax=Bifidobacterium rousetti TaxID=2045439 RepID=UPI00123B641A|nr:ParB/RepB/Spo0J family partition protein [Bifidobacterium rousetti]KAA8818930.1 chromosome partitioning protein ParB [Bifidobacterium rousetti]
MAAKSRLGKGLGALFPDLPGEEQSVVSRETHRFLNEKMSRQDQEEAAAKTTEGKALEPKPKAEVVTSRARVSVPPISSSVAGAGAAAKSSDASESAGAAAAESKSGSMSADTQSTQSPKKGSGKSKRATMPALGDIAHPSDMFFNDTVNGGASVTAGTTVAGVQGDDSVKHDAASDVSRETRSTVADEKTKDGKSDGESESEEQQLKPVEGGYLAELKLTDIGPNAHQPRTVFDEDDLNELAASIKEVGILQPIVVRRRPAAQIAEARKQQADRKPLNQFDGHLDSDYELIMGERRWRASQLAGLETIPAIVKTTSDDDMLRDALLENLHRVALNPLEEAAAYQQMIDEFGLTQAQLSKSVSKSRPQIANTLRLLNLPGAVQKKVAAGILTAGHARALLGLNDTAAMDKLANRIIAEGLSVRSTEEIVALANLESKEPKKPKANKNNPWAGSPIQTNLENHFDTKVSIKGTPKHGRIEIVFSSPEDMDRILALLMPGESGSPSDASASPDTASSTDGKWV